MFTLTGCHDQMAAVETKSLDFPVPLNDITPKPIPAQLASKVTLNNESDEEISKVNDKDIESPIFREISISQYHKTSMLNLELANKSWTDTYDGKGLPLFKISF
jgi:hypothetical protein